MHIIDKHVFDITSFLHIHENFKMILALFFLFLYFLGSKNMKSSLVCFFCSSFIFKRNLLK
jgi:hypothetical protein